MQIYNNAFKNATVKSLYTPLVNFVLTQAFENFHGKKLSFPNIRMIQNDTFINSDIESIDLPIVDSIGSRAFLGSKIESIYCPNCKTIGVLAFSRTQLRSFNSENVNKLGSEAFKGVETLISVELRNKVNLSDGVFDSCINLVNLSLPKIESLTGDYHFNNCTKLEIIDLSSLKEVNNSAANIFNNCQKLKVIYFGNHPPKTFSESISFDGVEIVLPSMDSWKNYISQCKVVKMKYVWYGFRTDILAPLPVWVYIVIVIACIVLISILGVILYRYIKKRRDNKSMQTPLI